MIQCPRCLKQCPDEYAVHTCNPTPLWRELEMDRDALRAQVAELEDVLRTILIYEESSWPCILKNCPKCAAYERADALVNTGDN